MRKSEASETNILSVRKRSGSNKCFICAKAKRQQQMFYLCESEAAATNVLSVRKRSGSNKCFICAKAKRQQQQSTQSERESTSHFAEEQHPFVFH
ncbi:hypothetical protein [Lysinibacillus sp. NPDC086135]|uniref:hypothetical protein n=1 Tax=Lysinibacillus sp. NPDC086135 TaxID=3364130 RepID=UPI003816ED8E